MDSLVTLAVFNDPSEAHIIRGMLESEGIAAFIFDERSAAYTPLTVGVRLAVRKGDLERAARLLRQEEQ